MIARRSMVALAFLLGTATPSPAAGPKFERIVIDADFPDGYQVEVADVNGDGKPDVVGVGGGTCAWYENPSWKKRVVSTPKDTPDIISSATRDLDGDGHAEIAIAFDFAMNEPMRGKLALAIQGDTLDDTWKLRPVESVSEHAPSRGGRGGVAPSAKSEAPTIRDDFPSIHRIRWGLVPTIDAASGKVGSSARLGLIVGSIFGPSARPPLYDQEPASLDYFEVGGDPKSGRWKKHPMGQFRVLHAIDVVDLGDAGHSAVLAASNEGATLLRWISLAGATSKYRGRVLTPGTPGTAPKIGSSEVHLGRYKDGGMFVATVEPWHGTDVAICAFDPIEPTEFMAKPVVGVRRLIDTTLKDGHALWVADVDGDGDDEIFAGYRGGDGGVVLYDRTGSDWARTVVDGAITAQDLRGGDLDGDGTPDVVAIGGRSHNVVWYRPIRNQGTAPAAR